MLRLWNVQTIVLCGTVANICVHYTAASAALRWYDVVIAKDAVSAIEPCDLEFSLRQTSWLFQGKIRTSTNVVARKRRSARAPAKRWSCLRCCAEQTRSRPRHTAGERGRGPPPPTPRTSGFGFA
jgi:hypothetical protein